MHSAEGVSRLVGDDLPFSSSFSNDVGAADDFSLGFLDTLDTELTKPRKADFSAGVTVCEQSPIGIAIISFATPLRKCV